MYPDQVLHGFSPKAAVSSFSLWAVADGHNGAGAAQHCQAALCDELMHRLPRCLPPAEGTPEASSWASSIRLAITGAFLAVNTQYLMTGKLSGTTLTVAVLMDWLLTVACVGDSKAALDVGTAVLELTPEHRVQTHEGERARLKALGTQIAQIGCDLDGPAEEGESGYGPLRAWPGGLCVSRAIGDIDVGSCILAHPHIVQLEVPSDGVRLALASDGVWDAISSKRLLKQHRSRGPQEAADAALRTALRAAGGVLSDDMSLCLVDILPPGCDTFSNAIVSQKAARKQALQPKPQEGDTGPRSQPKKTKGACFGCRSAPKVLEDFRLDMSYHGGEAQARAKLRFLADADSFEEFPDIKVNAGPPARISAMPSTAPSLKGVSPRPSMEAVQATHVGSHFSLDRASKQAAAPEDVSLDVPDPTTHAGRRFSLQQERPQFVGAHLSSEPVPVRAPRLEECSSSETYGSKSSPEDDSAHGSDAIGSISKDQQSAAGPVRQSSAAEAHSQNTPSTVDDTAHGSTAT